MCRGTSCPFFSHPFPKTACNDTGGCQSTVLLKGVKPRLGSWLCYTSALSDGNYKSISGGLPGAVQGFCAMFSDQASRGMDIQ